MHFVLLLPFLSPSRTPVVKENSFINRPSSPTIRFFHRQYLTNLCSEGGEQARTIGTLYRLNTHCLGELPLSVQRTTATTNKLKFILIHLFSIHYPNLLGKNIIRQVYFLII